MAARTAVAGRGRGSGRAFGQPPDERGEVPGASRHRGLRLRWLAGRPPARHATGRHGVHRGRAQPGSGRRAGLGQDASGDRHRRVRHHAPRQAGALLLDRGSGQRTGAGEGAGTRREDRGEPASPRPGHSGRTRISALQPGRRGVAIPPAEPPVRAYKRCGDNESGLRRMVQCVRRREDDHGIAGPADASLPHRGNRQRKLPFPP
ncbi:hypothetical protein R75777_08081 [Paraburkholderia nemoris]|nr:hypothetical protein R75777_08081 [Paraburkholderia nemoris]